MEKRVFLAIFLSFGILVLYQTYVVPPPPPPSVDAGVDGSKPPLPTADAGADGSKPPSPPNDATPPHIGAEPDPCEPTR